MLSKNETLEPAFFPNEFKEEYSIMNVTANTSNECLDKCAENNFCTYAVGRNIRFKNKTTKFICSIVNMEQHKMDWHGKKNVIFEKNSSSPAYQTTSIKITKIPSYEK